MVTVNNDIITKDTNWQLPQQIAQYNEYGVVNTETCYAFSNLHYLKKRDNTCASINGEGGVNNIHHSPIIYCYGYNFEIPDNAVITKIQIRCRRKCNTKQQNTNDGIKDRVIRLKIGATNTGYGEGYNQSTEAKWGITENGLTDYTYGNEDEGTVYQVWGVTVTPAMANNENFGCVLQCTGKTDLFMQPVIDCVEMRITYTQLGTTTTTPDKTSKEENIINPNQSPQVTSKVETSYQPDGQTEATEFMTTRQSIDRIYTPITFWIRYINNKISNNETTYIEKGYHDKVDIELENLRFLDGSTTMTIPKQVLLESTDKDDIERGYISKLYRVRVYPTNVGIGKITIKGLHKTKNNDTLSTEVLTVQIDESYTNVSNSLTTITNCSFKNCTATEGSAIYNTGRLIFSNLTLSDLSNTDKCLYDFDKYRDGEFR